MNQPHPEHKPGLLPTQGIPGSSYQPLSNQIYRYVARERSIDNPETKRWRKRMRGLEFQIFHIAHDAYACGLASDGKYFDSISLRDLEAIKAPVAPPVPVAPLVGVTA